MRASERPTHRHTHIQVFIARGCTKSESLECNLCKSSCAVTLWRRSRQNQPASATRSLLHRDAAAWSDETGIYIRSYDECVDSAS